MTDARVKESYQASKPPKAKAKAKAKAKSISRSGSGSRSKSRSGSGSGSNRYSRSPAKKAKIPNATKKLLKKILEDSGSFDPLASPKKQNSTKQLVKTILEESPLKLSTPEVIRKRRAVQRPGVVGSRTGAIVKRQVARDADSFEDIDEFFESSSSSERSR
jgi:hypothetical protein